MKKVTSADSLITINHYKNLLTSEGIPAFLKNEHFGSIMGEVPFQEVWPELWVETDLDYDRATQLIDSAKIAEESPSAPWNCPSCGTENEGQYDPDKQHDVGSACADLSLHHPPLNTKRLTAHLEPATHSTRPAYRSRSLRRRPSARTRHCP